MLLYYVLFYVIYCSFVYCYIILYINFILVKLLFSWTYVFLQVIYSGRVRAERINLWQHNNHFDIIKSLTGFYGSNFYCLSCNVAYQNETSHMCADVMCVFETNVLSRKKLDAMNVRGYVAPLNVMNVTKTHPDRKCFPFVIK